MPNWNTIFRKEGKVYLEIQEDMKSVAKVMKKAKAKKVLDLGCGSGRHTVFLAANILLKPLRFFRNKS